MSDRASAQAWADRRAKGTEKLVLLKYADYARDDGSGACPSAKTLADDTGLDESTIRRIRARLVELGCIRIRAQMSEYGTPIIDMIYSDGSNAAVIRTLYDEKGVQNAPPRKTRPESVVVLPDSSPDQDSGNTTTEIGVQIAPPSQFAPPPPPPEPPTDTEPEAPNTDVDTLLNAWRDCGVEGEYLHALAALISQRPNAAAEVDDILDYWEAWNQYTSTDRRLGPGWIVSQLKSLAVMSRHTPRTFRWLDHAPPKAARPEYWRQYTAETNPYTLEAQLADPQSLLAQLLPEEPA